MRGGPAIEWREEPGRPTTVGNRTITPVARSFVVRWPGGGFVWSGPAAVLVDREGSSERIPIVDLDGRIRRVMRVGALTLVAAWIARSRRRRKSDD